MLQADWDTTFDDILSSQRQLEVVMVQWTSYEDSFKQLDQWVKSTELQLSDQLPLHNTLEDKKSQLNVYKVRIRHAASLHSRQDLSSQAHPLHEIFSVFLPSVVWLMHW